MESKTDSKTSKLVELVPSTALSILQHWGISSGIFRTFRDLTKFWLVITLTFGWVCLPGCDQRDAEDNYLIRVGEQSITLSDFKRSFEAAEEEAFPDERDVEPEALSDLRMRVLNQLTEELIITEYAKSLGINVSKEELDQAVETIKADYPDDTFEKTLLENAVSFTAWKRKLGARMLLEKVIAKELIDKVEITSEDVAIYIQTHFPQGAPEGESVENLNQKIVQHLRHQKAEQAYMAWMDGLRKSYPVDINKKQWQRLVDTKP